MGVKIPYLSGVPQGTIANPGSTDVARRQGESVASLAGKVNSVAGQVFDVQQKIQQVNNDGKLADLKTQTRQAAMAYDQSLVGNNEPGSWVPGFDKAMGTFTANAKVDSLPPDVRDAYKGWEAEFKNQQANRLGAEANVFSIEQYKLAKNNAMATARDMRDYDGMRAEITNDRYSTPEEKKKAFREIDGIQEQDNLEEAILSDPKSTLERLQSEDYLKQPGASYERQQWGIKQAKVQFQTFQKEAIKGIADEIDRGAITTEAQLTERLKGNRYIEEGMHDEVLFHFQQSQPLDAETRFAIADNLNDLHDAYKAGEINEEEYRVAHDGLAQVVYSFGARDGSGALRKRVNDLDPAAWNGKNLQGAGNNPGTRAIQRIAKTFEDSGAFGKVTEEEAKNMAPFDLANKRTQIFNTRAKLEASMESWLKANPNASQEAIDTQFKKEYLNNAASTILRPGGAWATQPEVLDFIKETTPQDDPKGASSKISTEPVGGNLKEMVKHFEAGGEKTGFHEKAYWDYGQWSIGYGTRSKEGETITKDEAEKRLDDELSVHKKRVLSANESLKLNLKPHEIDALTSFDYNTGSLEKLLNGGTRSKAQIASTMLLYRNAKGKRLPGLERRRLAESTLFRRGYSAAKQELVTDPNPEDNFSQSDSPDDVPIEEG